MRYFTLQFGIVAIICMGIAACAQKAPRAIITFDCEPIPDAAPGFAKATFAIVKTQFEGPMPLFSTFASNMEKNFAEILTAHGFGVRDPFISYDNMTYSDRAGTPTEDLGVPVYVAGIEGIRLYPLESGLEIFGMSELSAVIVEGLESIPVSYLAGIGLSKHLGTSISTSGNRPGR